MDNENGGLERDAMKIPISALKEEQMMNLPTGVLAEIAG